MLLEGRSDWRYSEKLPLKVRPWITGAVYYGEKPLIHLSRGDAIWIRRVIIALGLRNCILEILHELRY